METREETIARIRCSNENITRYAPAYRALAHRDFDSVYPLVMGYIRDRFLLTEDMCHSENLLDLADVSLRQLLELKRRNIDAGEIARSCSGASSVISKKVLLMKAVQEEFGVSMTPGEFAQITTVSDLAVFLCKTTQTTSETVAAKCHHADFDVAAVRRDFPALSETVHGYPLVYMDNAATAQCPRSVLNAVEEIEVCRGNVHRGVHTLSNRCTDAYERARKTCAMFLHAQPGQITFTSGATDGINRVAAAFAQQTGGIVTTALEHHSGFVPWQQLCLREKRPFRVCPILPNGTLDLDVLDGLLDKSISLLSITGCSNVLGTVPPLDRIIPLAHSRGVKVLVDGAQSVCHRDVDLTELDCDFFVCSGHKLGGPFGIGLLYCKEPLPPAMFGGGMVDRVTELETTFLSTLEAGTPNISGAVGMAAAVLYRQALPGGWQDYERALLHRARTLLAEIPGVHILGPSDGMGCISFVIDGISTLEAAALLDQMGFALRSGDHCAQPLHRALGVKYTLRISPSFYNTLGEIEALADGLRQIIALAKPV